MGVSIIRHAPGLSPCWGCFVITTVACNPDSYDNDEACNGKGCRFCWLFFEVTYQKEVVDADMRNLKIKNCNRQRQVNHRDSDNSIG